MIARRKSLIIFVLGFSIGLSPFVLQTLTHMNCNINTPLLAENTVKSNEYNVEMIKEARTNGMDHVVDDEWSPPRKILLDCGANVTSTVELFRNTYPGGRDYIIHSFELDRRLGPYFNPYQNHVLHCPVGVAASNGNMTAFTEAAWSPTGGENNGIDMQWGGGTLFVSDAEKINDTTGGKRRLSIRPTVPTVDLSKWIQENTRIEDYVIFKLDVEGAEYDILEKMLEDGTFEWVDKYYGEFHRSQPVKGWPHKEKLKMIERVENEAPRMHDWAGERRTYLDFNDMHPMKVPADTPGKPGGVYSHCNTEQQVAIILAVGMNMQRAHKIVSIIEAYGVKLPVMLFVYGDFAVSHPEVVKMWATKFDVGMREDGPYPLEHFLMLESNWVRESLTNAELRLQEIGIQPSYYLPVNVTKPITKAAQLRGFRVAKPNVMFPPIDRLNRLTNGNYYRFRDVERVPKALRLLDKKLVEEKSAILSLDTDESDTRMILVFLLDYLVESSGMKIVSLPDCIA